MSKKTAASSGEPIPVIIIVCIILISALASYIVPAGSFTRIEDPNTGRSVVDPTSFQLIDQNPTGIFELFQSVSAGIQGSSSIIAFCVGGRFL